MSTTTLDDLDVGDRFASPPSTKERAAQPARRQMTVAGVFATLGAVIAISAIGATAIWYIHLTTPATPSMAPEARQGVRLPNGSRIPLTVNGVDAATPVAPSTRSTVAPPAGTAPTQRAGATTSTSATTGGVTASSSAASVSSMPSASAPLAAPVSPSAAAGSPPRVGAPAAVSPAIANSAAAGRATAANGRADYDDPLRALIDASTARANENRTQSGSLSWSPSDRVRAAPSREVATTRP